ncbi:MAG: sigma-54-dependent Fis family transcriptional regulator, partial [Myxococcales bacterium]|nr:sigma-54-dependent Fis family transcriptional regulator [Myxococcales bacterium]
MSMSVLVIDDDKAMCELVEAGLSKRGYSVEWRTDGGQALSLLTDHDFDVVITDLNLDGMSGLDVCAGVQEKRPGLPVVVITGFGDMKAAIAAIRAGAYDFINKPVEMEALAHSIDRAVQHRHLQREVKRLTEEVGRAKGVGDLVGESLVMKEVYDLIRRVGPSEASVLLSGESGTGKELVARALHLGSPRKDRPFVAINCAAVPGNLLESELFG